jgi:hypothetical protein
MDILLDVHLDGQLDYSGTSYGYPCGGSLEVTPHLRWMSIGCPVPIGMPGGALD